MIRRETIWKIYEKINFQDHDTDGIAEGLGQVVREDLGELLSEVDDLDAVTRAVEREREIRLGMMRTGQGREPVADFLDAQASMDQEAVLDLTDGEPTTLADALRRYIAELEKLIDPDDEHAEDMAAWAEVVQALSTILDYPWPEDERRIQLHDPHYGLALHFSEEENRDLVVRMGSNRWEVARVNWEDAGSGGQLAAQAVAEAVYRGTLARVIADREHIVKLNLAETAQLRRTLNGEERIGTIGDRLTVEPSGGGVWIRTRPTLFQRVPR